MTDNLILVCSLAFLGWLWYGKNRNAIGANNTAPYWYTLAGTKPLMFDFSSQSNYHQEMGDNHGD